MRLFIDLLISAVKMSTEGMKVYFLCGSKAQAFRIIIK